MAIVQISKIQQRSGNLVDLPQLDEAEFGWASDAKLLYIGKTTPNENVEVLTSYSHISFGQLDGSVGNLNISPATVANGQVLAFDGTNWVNKGGNAGGLITLGAVENVKITGGAIGYVLETDGTGNLSWTPKGTISANILTVTNANPGVVTTTVNNLFTDGMKVTITDARGMTQLNGNTYYADVLSSNTFALYTDAALTVAANTSAFTPYAYTNVSNTFAANNAVKVGNSSSFTVNYPVKFVGDMTGTNLGNTATYYIKTIPSSTTITVSAELLPNGVAGNVVVLANANGLTANVYSTGGRILSSLVSTGGGGGNAAGSTTAVQYNAGGLLGGSTDFTYDNSTKIATINGNINVSNVNAGNVISASRFISNVATGTAPLTVNSATLVPNLYASRANVSDFNVVNVQSTGTFYPTFVNGAANANYALASNAVFSANLANGSFTATTFVGNLFGLANTATTAATVTTNAQPNITSVGNLSSLTVNGTSGILSIDSTGTTSSAKIIRAFNGTQDISFIPRAPSGAYNSMVENNDAVLTYADSASQGNANLSIVPWASANSGIRIQSVANTATIFLNASVTNVNAAMNVTGNLAAGNVSGTLLTGTLSTAAQPNITSVSNAFGNLTLAANNDIVLSGAASFISGANLVSANFVSGNGLLLTALNASNISTGTLAQARLANSSLIVNGVSIALGGSGTITASTPQSLSNGSYITGSSFNGGTATTWAVDATTTNTAGKVVARDSNGSFAANVVTATLVGSATSATTAGTVTTNTQPNITSVGNLTTLTVVGAASAGSLSAGNVSFTGSNVSLGGIGNVKISGGTNGFVVVTDGTGNLTFANPVTVGTQPAGANTQVQFNDGGALGATANFTFTKTTNNLYSGGNVTAVAGLYGAILSTTGNANVNGNINVGANALITLSANIGGSLDVSGAANLKSNLIVAGNVTSSTGRFIGNGAGLTNLTGSNVVGAVDSAITAATVTTAAQPNITSVTSSGGTLTIGATSNGGTYVRKAIQVVNSASDLTTGAQIVLAFAGVGGLTNQANSTWNLDVNSSNNFRLFSLDATGTLGTPITAYSSNSDVLFGSNVNVSGRLNSTGNVTAPFFIGSGATLTSVPGGNVTGTVANAAYATNSGTASSVAWTNVSGRPTALSSFTNDVGYITTPVPSGTNMLFYQASAPTGWTKVTTSNDAALRVVSGSGGGTGGTVNFSSAFTSQAVSGTVGDTSLTELQMPSHYHYTVSDQVVNGGKVNSSGPIAWSNGNNPGEEEYELAPGTTTATLGRTSSTGGSQSHTHTFSGTSINLAVKYIDVIVAYKN
jgi:hypothetical protein